jgi:hypothetical protein
MVRAIVRLEQIVRVLIRARTEIKQIKQFFT